MPAYYQSITQVAAGQDFREKGGEQRQRDSVFCFSCLFREVAVFTVQVTE
jgi:hypothetical protein